MFDCSRADPVTGMKVGVTDAVRGYAWQRDVSDGFLLAMPQRQVSSSMAAALPMPDVPPVMTMDLPLMAQFPSVCPRPSGI